MANDIARGDDSALPAPYPQDHAWAVADEVMRTLAPHLDYAFRATRLRYGRGDLDLIMAGRALDQLRAGAERLAAVSHIHATLTRPGTTTQIKQRLALLLKALPNVGIGDLTVFGRLLAEDVGSKQPTIGALDRACLALRQTENFIPTIAKVLSRLAIEEAQLRKWSRLAEDLPPQIELLKQKIEEEREYERTAETRAAEIRTAQKAEIRRRLEDGKSVALGSYPKALIEEVESELREEISGGSEKPERRP